MISLTEYYSFDMFSSLIAGVSQINPRSDHPLVSDTLYATFPDFIWLIAVAAVFLPANALWTISTVFYFAFYAPGENEEWDPSVITGIVFWSLAKVVLLPLQAFLLPIDIPISLVTFVVVMIFVAIFDAIVSTSTTTE